MLKATIRTKTHRLRDEAAFLAWSTAREGRTNAIRLRALKGRYQGRRAIVMGNGPSLLRTDLNEFADDVTIVSNANYLIWDQLTYIPTFLTVEDRLVAEDRADELQGLSGTTAIFPYEHRDLLGPATESRIYVNFVKHYSGFPRFSHAFDRRGYWGGTVSFMNLQLASYLGCNPIVLAGFDHFYQLPATDRTGSVIESKDQDVNHIHPDYFGPGYRWHDPQVERMELGYAHARVALEKVGVRVLNGTDGGALEVFDRIALPKAPVADRKATSR